MLRARLVRRLSCLALAALAALAAGCASRPPPLSPPNFRLVFEPGSERARYMVTPVGVGERRAE